MNGTDELRSADAIEPLRYIDRERVQRLIDDVSAKADAGAALAYAIYHGGVDFAVSMPDSVARAYMRACEAYGIGRK